MVSHCQRTIVKVLTALEATVCSLEDTEAEKLLMNGTALEIETPVLLRSTLTNTRSADLEVDGIIHATMQQEHSQDFSKWGGGGGSHCVKVRVLTRLSLWPIYRHGIFATSCKLFG